MVNLIQPLEILAKSNVRLRTYGDWDEHAMNLRVVVTTHPTENHPGKYLIGPDSTGRLPIEISPQMNFTYVANSIKPDFERGSLDINLEERRVFGPSIAIFSWPVITPYNPRPAGEFTIYSTSQGFGDYRHIYPNIT